MQPLQLRRKAVSQSGLAAMMCKLRHCASVYSGIPCAVAYSKFVLFNQDGDQAGASGKPSKTMKKVVEAVEDQPVALDLLPAPWFLPLAVADWLRAHYKCAVRVTFGPSPNEHTAQSWCVMGRLARKQPETTCMTVLSRLPRRPWAGGRGARTP